MNLEKFTKFLQTVDLQGYREKYLPIKIVEMDMPKNIFLNYQVKKETFSREVRRDKKFNKSLEGEYNNITYKVPDFKILISPYKKDGKEFRKAYLEFKKDWLDTNIVEVLKNGFVIFKPALFIEKKREIDSRAK